MEASGLSAAYVCIVTARTRVTMICKISKLGMPVGISEYSIYLYGQVNFNPGRVELCYLK